MARRRPPSCLDDRRNTWQQNVKLNPRRPLGAVDPYPAVNCRAILTRSRWDRGLPMWSVAQTARDPGPRGRDSVDRWRPDLDGCPRVPDPDGRWYPNVAVPGAGKVTGPRRGREFSLACGGLPSVRLVCPVVARHRLPGALDFGCWLAYDPSHDDLGSAWDPWRQETRTSLTARSRADSGQTSKTWRVHRQRKRAAFRGGDGSREPASLSARERRLVRCSGGSLGFLGQSDARRRSCES